MQISSQTIEKIFVGAFLALVTAVINQMFAGRFDFLWVILGILFVLIFLWIFQGQGFPYTKYRVTNNYDGKGLLFRSDNFVGKKIGDAWQFVSDKDDWVIFGPYLRQPLHKGNYRATFRLKIDDVTSANRSIVELGVAAKCQNVGDKRLTDRTISTRDFKTADKYQNFTLDFFIISDENDLELRIFSLKTNHTITLDYVELSKRLV